MKNTIKWFGITTLVAVLATACQNPTNPTKPTPQQGYGTVSINFGDENSRTVYPIKAFDSYVYTFTKQGGEPQIKTSANGIFTLEAGNWTVRVDAYVGTVALANLAAWGTADFMLNDNEHKNILITLEAKEDEGFGTFTWHIQYPAETTVETFTLRKLPSMVEAALTPQTQATSISGTVENIPAGMYLFDIKLENGGLYAGINEVVYVYALLSTEYGTAQSPIVFSEADFSGELLFTSLEEIAQYLLAHEGGTIAGNSISLPLQIDLGIMPEVGSGWQNLLDVIEAADKFVDLDLTACTMDGTVFDPVFTLATGKDRIVSISLPDVARSLAEQSSSNNINFSHFSNLKTVSGAEITRIAVSSFCGLTSLESARFPRATYIGSYAFNDCTSLTNVSFRASASISFDGEAFMGCTSLTNFILIGTGSLKVLEDGKALVRNNTELVAYPSASGSIVMDTIITISNNTFAKNTNIESVSFPSVTSVKDSAFSNCTSLIRASFPSATSFGAWVFSNCTSLESVSFHASAVGRDWGLGATLAGSFYNCPNLTNFDLVGTGYLNVLEGGKALVSNNNTHLVAYPSAVSIKMETITSIGLLAFAYSPLISASFPAATSIGQSAFTGCNNLTNVYIPSVTSIGNNSFLTSSTIGYVHPTTLTITLGATPPMVAASPWQNIRLNIIVQFPATAAATYGPAPTNRTDQNWGNGFRGMGWDGTSYLQDSASSYAIGLTYKLLESVTFAYYWVNEQEVIATVGGSTTLPKGNTLQITAVDNGYTNHRWFVNGVEETALADSANFTFSSLEREAKQYTIGLIVQKGGKYYNANFVVTVTE